MDMENQNENIPTQDQPSPDTTEPETLPPPKVYAPPNPTIETCINLYLPLPIRNTSKNIDAFSSILYSNENLFNEFLQRVDNRTEISTSDPKGSFIKCEQNRDGDSYRSPISNKYYPSISDAKYPSTKLRGLEEKLNTMFKQYIKLYYSNTACHSCYCWDFGSSPSEGFGVAVVIKNNLHQSSWDSTNVFKIEFVEDGKQIKAKYNLFSFVTLIMEFKGKMCGTCNLAGTISRTDKRTYTVKEYTSDEHVENIGKMVEDMETRISNTMDTIYVMKSREILETARCDVVKSKFGDAFKHAFKQGGK